MKKGLFLFLLFCANLSFGQFINAPLPLSIEANASNVDAGNFAVNWINTTDNILVSLSLDYHIGATLSFPTNSGLNLNTGYSTWNGVSSIVFYGNQTNVNNALAAMTISMGSDKTAVKINLEVTAYDVNYKYNPINKHFYKYVAGNVSYASAKSNAGNAANDFKGKTGYLVTITNSQEQEFLNTNITGNNIWVALTDVTTEGTWVIDAGPEKGTVLKTQNGQTAGNISGQYNNWCSGEPNDSGNNEDYAVTKWGGGTCWNDVTGTSTVEGYIVEISADFPAGTGYTGVYSSYVIHNNEKAFTKATSTGINSTSISNSPNLFGGLQVNNGHTLTLRSGHTLNSNRIDLVGSGKVVFTDATTKWIPGSSNIIDTYMHSPNTNTNPTYWIASSTYDNDPFSSSAGNYFTPYLNSLRGWSALNNNAGQYLILSTDVPRYISGIVTQSRANNSDQWVKSAKIEYSLNGTDYYLISENLTLNSNNITAITALFPEVVFAKYIKVTPTDQNVHKSMRLGLVIKSNNIVSDGLVLHLDAGNLASYKGTGTAWKDLSGNSADAVMSGITYNSSGSHFEFNGTTSYATFSANIGDPSVVSVEMWVKVISFGGMLFGFTYYDAWTASSNLGYNTASGDQFGISSTQVSALGILSKWKHLVFIMNKGTTVGNKIYVNGVSQLMNNSTGAERANAVYNSGEGRISSWGAGNNWPMNMHLGNFRVYKRELTQLEISDNFEAQRSRFGL